MSHDTVPNSYTSDIAAEEASLADLVVTGTNLLTAVEDVLKFTESLSSITGEQTYTINTQCFVLVD